jgi:hypothetical protein
MVDAAIVDAEFFGAVGIPIVRGRSFTRADRADTQRVAVISEAMAARFWPGEDALGRTFRQHDGTELRVVGVARDAKVLDLSEPPRPFLYQPYSQSYTAMVQVIARTGRDPEQVALDMVAAAREVDPELVLWAPTTMARHLGFVLLPARLSAWLLSAFAVLAVILASIGLYGIVSYSVAQRTREVGIRLSLGASTRSVVTMLVGSGMRLAAVGGTVGLVASLLLARTLHGLLYGVEPLDVASFVTAALTLAAVAVVAAGAAALRASRIDPADALRAE